MFIVFACQLSVDAYVELGRDVEVPRPDCPACSEAVDFWGVSERYLRIVQVVKLLVRRVRCMGLLARRRLVLSPLRRPLSRSNSRRAPELQSTIRLGRVRQPHFSTTLLRIRGTRRGQGRFAVSTRGP